MKRWILLVLTLLLLMPTLVLARQEFGTDTIPNNCEYTGEYRNANWFMRYAYNEGRIVLVDWSSGEVVRVLESDVTAAQVLFVNWSPNCRYLVGAIGDGLWFTTVIWDATDGTRIGTVENGYRTSHEVTWSPRSDQVVVETRRGAFLWTLATGERVQLTRDSWWSDNFRAIAWDYERHILDTQTAGGVYVHFDLTTGNVVATSVPTLSLNDNQTMGAANVYVTWLSVVSVVTEPNSDAPYGCDQYASTNSHYAYETTLLPAFTIWFGANQLSVIDDSTREIVHVIASDLADLPAVSKTPALLSSDCEYLFTLHFVNGDRAVPRTGIVWRMRDDSRAYVIEDIPAGRWIDYTSSSRNEWDASGRYLFVQTYNGAQIWDSDTGRVIWLSTAGESARNGYSVESPHWDLANGRVTVEMLYLDETRTFDLNTGERVS